jgi:hypothetical protein
VPRARHDDTLIALLMNRTEPSHRRTFRPLVWALLADMEQFDGGKAHPCEFGNPTC